MGVTIRGRFDGSQSYDMGYITFGRLREDIAYTVSDEFGLHYEKLPDACARRIDVEAYDQRTKALLNKYHCKEGVLWFLYQPDAEGKLSPRKCKSLFNQISGMTNKKLYGYTARPKDCMTIEAFKELLKQCFERKVYLEWY